MTGHKPGEKPDEQSGGSDFSSNRGNADDPWTDEQDGEPIPLTQAEAMRMFGPDVSRPSRVTPFRVVGAQVSLSLIATLVCWLFVKRPGTAALSAFLGGALAWIPGALFALRISRGGLGSPAGWVTGEALKIGATVALFAAIAYGLPGIRWVPLLLTYLLALKVYWVALAWR